MKYEGFTTFRVKIDGAICIVTFDLPPVNVLGLPMLADLNMLAQKLEADKSVKVMIFDSAHPEIWVCHADTEFLKDMLGKAVSRNEVKLLDLHVVLERISRLPQATRALRVVAVTSLHLPATCALQRVARPSLCRWRLPWAFCRVVAAPPEWRMALQSGPWPRARDCAEY